MHVPWDAVDTWLEEGRKLVHYPPNPYHRVDCRPTHRALRVVVAGETLVDTSDTMIVFETALAPVLYVDPSHVRTDLLRRSNTSSYCNYKGYATYWSAVIGDTVVEDIAWSYEDPCPKPGPSRGFSASTPLAPTLSPSYRLCDARHTRRRDHGAYGCVTVGYGCVCFPWSGTLPAVASVKGRALGHYIANVRDLEFNLFEVLDLSPVLDSGGYGDLDTATVREILGEVARLSEGPIADSFVDADRNPPRFVPGEHTITVPVGWPVGAAFKDAGWWRIGMSEVIGGVPAPAPVTWAVNEMMVCANPAAFSGTALRSCRKCSRSSAPNSRSGGRESVWNEAGRAPWR